MGKIQFIIMLLSSFLLSLVFPVVEFQRSMYLSQQQLKEYEESQSHFLLYIYLFLNICAMTSSVQIHRPLSHAKELQIRIQSLTLFSSFSSVTKLIFVYSGCIRPYVLHRHHPCRYIHSVNSKHWNFDKIFSSTSSRCE